MVPAIVLTAGLATRLRPLSLVRAKAALPVAGEALARRILRTLATAGITDVVLNLHHLPHTLTAIVGDGADLGLHVRYSWESPVLGSAGGPKRALPLLFPELGTPDSGRGVARSDETFLIVNGDTLSDVDIGAVIRQHRETGALVTMAVVPNTEPEKYGGLRLDAEGAVTGFTPRGSTEPSYHFFGVQAAETRAFDSVPPDTPYETVRTLYPALIAARPGSVRAFISRAEYFDIGTTADYLSTSLRLGEREGQAGSVHPRARIEAGARVEQSVLWDDVVVEAGAMLRECVVTDGVRVPADTSWHGVTLRIATGELMPGERRVDGLAIAAL